MSLLVSIITRWTLPAVTLVTYLSIISRKTCFVAE